MPRLELRGRARQSQRAASFFDNDCPDQRPWPSMTYWPATEPVAAFGHKDLAAIEQRAAAADTHDSTPGALCQLGGPSPD